MVMNIAVIPIKEEFNLDPSMIGIIFVFSVAFSLPHQLLPKEAIGTGMGMVNTGAQAAEFIAHIVMGFIISATGSYDTAFFFLVACGILSTIAALSIKKKDRKVSSQNAEVAME
jgi:sugar phosphate permease